MVNRLKLLSQFQFIWLHDKVFLQNSHLWTDVEGCSRKLTAKAATFSVHKHYTLHVFFIFINFRFSSSEILHFTVIQSTIQIPNTRFNTLYIFPVIKNDFISKQFIEDGIWKLNSTTFFFAANCDSVMFAGLFYENSFTFVLDIALSQCHVFACKEQKCLKIKKTKGGV